MASVEGHLANLRSLRVRHGLRAEALLPDLALIGLIDDTIDAAETALQLLETERPYRAYAMVRVAFEAAQRLLILGTADDHIAVGTRAWLYYQAKDAVLRGGEDVSIRAAEDQLVAIWQSRFPSAAAVVLQERNQLAQRKRGAPDNFLGENLASSIGQAYQKIAAERGTTVPAGALEMNSAIYRSLCRDTHACMRIEPISIRVDSEGFVEIDSRPRYKAEVELAVRAGLATSLSEAVIAVEFRLNQRQQALAIGAKERLSLAAPARRSDYLPDFGAYIVGIGAGHTTLVFPDLPIQLLYGLPDGALSCSATTTRDGLNYIATFDFRGDARGKVLKLIEGQFPNLTPKLEEIAEGTRIDMQRPILCTVTALVGRVQVTDMETFAPLVVVDVVSALEPE
ncbi:MAG TPA: hypothetical protein VNV25_07680 [Gemmatimonadaceae bacterium]|jgi:hypothetical protein|nr:hypothetical protein [Gemmatimonadaceae bacterium]